MVSPPESSSAPPSAACVLLAIASGLIATLSAVAIAYPANRAAREKRKQSKTEQFVILVSNLALSGVSILLGILANGQGPVAVAFPLGVGSNLLSNMVLQSNLGIAQYTKSMRVGTMVLAAAVLILPDNGPSDLPADVDVMALLQTKAAIGFICACFVAMVCGLVVLMRGQVKDNMRLILVFTVVGGTGTVLSTSISKLVQMKLGPHIIFPLLVIYVLLGCLCLGTAATANATLEDPSLFVPLGAGVNLVMMFVAGLCIWGDGQRLARPLSYCMIYVLVVLGTYLVSSFDLVGSSHTQITADRIADRVQAATVSWKRQSTLTFWERSMTLPSSALAALPQCQSTDLMTDSVKTMLQLWNEGSEDTSEAKEALRKCLVRGLDRSQIDNSAIVELCLALVQEPGVPGSFRTEGLESWLKEHVHSFALATDESQPHDDLKARILNRSASLF